MAYKRFSYSITKQLSGDGKSVAAFLIATDSRVLVHQISILPRGATGASAPMLWEWGTHDAAGVADDDNATLVKEPPTYAAEIVTTVRKDYTSEPAFVKHFKVTAHQQQQRIWQPPVQPFFMEEGERWALKCQNFLAVDVEYEFILEE